MTKALPAWRVVVLRGAICPDKGMQAVFCSSCYGPDDAKSARDFRGRRATPAHASLGAAKPPFVLLTLLRAFWNFFDHDRPGAPKVVPEQYFAWEAWLSAPVWRDRALAAMTTMLYLDTELVGEHFGIPRRPWVLKTVPEENRVILLAAYEQTQYWMQRLQRERAAEIAAERERRRLLGLPEDEDDDEDSVGWIQ